MASSPLRRLGWRMVVSPSWAAGGASSKPAIERSSGTRSPRRAAARKVPSASRSLRHSRAVGRGVVARTASAPGCSFGDRAVGALGDGHAAPVQPGADGGVTEAREPTAADREGGLGLEALVDQAPDRLAVQAKADDPETAMAA
jgi:hypothetical protein